eukprot:608362-Prorocentrum_lima.AAC.1
MGMRLLCAFRVAPNLYTGISAHTNGAMPTTHTQIDHVKVLLRKWSRLLEQGPYSIHTNAREDGRARQFPNGANVSFGGMIADSPLP